MTKKRIAIFITISFISGIVLGVLGVSAYLGKTISDSLSILAMQNRAEWQIRAFRAYKTENPQLAIWALTNLTEILLEDSKIYLNDRDLILKDLLLAYARLALVFQSQNDNKNYKKSITQAIELSKEVYPNEFQSEMDLINFAKKWDNLVNRSID